MKRGLKILRQAKPLVSNGWGVVGNKFDEEIQIALAQD